MKIYKSGMKPTINSFVNSFTRKKAAAIGHILITCFVNIFFKAPTFKTNISDHFPICILFLSHEIPNLKESAYLYIKLHLLTNLGTAYSKLIGMKFN